MNKVTVTKDMLFEEMHKYLNEDSINLVTKAYEYAYEMHKDQKRKSGEPYFVHLLNVAYIIATLRGGPQTISAGLLHDTIEDCGISHDEFKKEFGEDITVLVEAVTKLDKIAFTDEKEYEAANHRKIFIAMAKDVRVIIVKLVDRLHNMRTLNYLTAEQQKRIASETLEVYAPIAHRLGLGEIKNEMEDLCFLYLDPDHYHEIAHLVAEKKEERKEKINLMISDITTLLSDKNIEFRIFGRSKHLYSIYHKMETKHKAFEEIYDLQAIRIVTQSDLNCYEILGYIHAQYNPMPGRFKDYIAMPKSNLYQSLHTTIFDDDGNIFEIQIRTEEMDSIAEKGVAAHWSYKEGKNYNSVNEQKEIEDKLGWYHDLIDITNTTENSHPKEFMDAIQKDIFDANIYVLSPKGRVIELPNGSTPIDFAYRIHTEVGHSMIGALVNGAISPLNKQLKTGDIVTIKTSKQSNGPSEEWIKIAHTTQARNKIRAWFQKKEFDDKKELIEKGEKQLLDELDKYNLDHQTYLDKTHLQSIYSLNIGINSYNDLCYAIGTKSANVSNIVNKIANQKLGSNNDNETLIKLYNKDKPFTISKTNVVVEGIDNMKIALAGCCLPVYGDNIVGYVSQGLGVKVHRKDCPNVINETRLIDVYWGLEPNDNEYECWLSIEALDRNFLISDIVTTISQYRSNLMAINSEVLPDLVHATIQVKVKVKDVNQLKTMMSNIKKLNGISEVERIIK